MIVVTEFDIGDTVYYGPHDNAKIMRIEIFSSAHIAYHVQFWLDGTPIECKAYPWELKLVEKAKI